MPRLTVTDTVSVYQFTRTGSKESYSASPAYQNQDVCISPMGTDIQPSGDVPAFQLFEIFFYDVTCILHNADKIVTQDGVTYILDGVPYKINNQFLKYIRCMAKQVV